MDKLSTENQAFFTKVGEEQVKSLLRHKPYLQLYFTGGLDDSIQYSPAKNGQPVFQIRQTGHEPQFLASQYDPLKEASRMIPTDLDQLDSATIIVISGIGNPFVFDLILSRLKPDQICIALDASFGLGSYLCRNWTAMFSFLKKSGAHLFCGSAMLAYLERYMDSLPTERLSGVRVIQNRASHKIDNGFYQSVENKIREILQARMSDLLTRFAFEPLWMKNIVSNSQYLAHKKEDGYAQKPMSENLLSYKDTLQGIPGVLVSAGPSLPKSFADIKKLKMKAFILACDTALKPLLKAGIVPHAVFGLDAQKHSLFHLLGEDLQQMVFFVDIVIHPFVLEHIDPGSVIFSTTARSSNDASGSMHYETTPGTPWLEAIHGPIGSLQSGGSVATSAFDLLRTLGCSKIILTGQDLAYTNRQLHSVGVHHYEKWNSQTHRLNCLENINQKIIQKRKTYHNTGIQNQSVISDYVLDIYKIWFEDSIKSIDTRVYNLTRNGNYIKNAIIPANITDFIEALDEQNDLHQKFKLAPPLTKHHHDENAHLLDELKAALSAENFGEKWEHICKNHPTFQELNRKMEVYLKRNSAKLSPQRLKKLTEDFKIKSAHQMYQKLRKSLINMT